jgi:glycosyltransferase involved in cell wall biosynthesis
MKSILIQAWVVHKFQDSYYLPYTHWVYLNEIVKYYGQVCLLSPVSRSETANTGLVPIEFSNAYVMELPYSNSYIGSLKYFHSYFATYKNLKHFDVSYARYPTPFGWLQKIFLIKTKRIIHFVGDPIDAAKSNPNFNVCKKATLITFFMPEHLIYMWACRGAKVYTNGFHLADRLCKYGVKATPLISSTLIQNDFYIDSGKVINSENLKLLYVGYLRRAKGVETVIRAFHLVQKKYKNAQLTIIGDGEFHSHLNQIVVNNRIQNVSFLGHIDDRNKLNCILRDHDIFCFASLSEGSPRVILEAMANGINIVSTQVGSLADIFQNDKDIVFANLNDEKDFFLKIDDIVTNKEKAVSVRFNAYNKVKEYTIERFIKNIFYES